MSEQNEQPTDMTETMNEPPESTDAVEGATEPTDAATRSTAASPTTVAVADPTRGRRKVRVGVVVSDKMDKTVLVRIDRKVRHPLYKKTVARSNKLAAHDEDNEAHLGDTVRVMETRPLSKTKRWRVVEIVERAR
jgi:small subunit ribosomal protein S17